MMKRFLTLGTMLLAFAALVSPALAGSDAESKTWLKKMADFYGKGAMSYDMSMQMTMNQGGMNMTTESKGLMTFKDPTHYNISMNTNVSMGGQNSMEVKMLSIADGETIWTEVENPMMGGKQVSKVAISQMEAIAQAQGLAGFSGMSSVSPEKMFEVMESLADWIFQGIKDGKAVISGKLNRQSIEKIKQSPQGAMFDLENTTLIIKADEKNIFPLNMEMAFGETIKMEMAMTNQKMLKGADLKPELFTYTPPEGAIVQDLAEMLEH